MSISEYITGIIDEFTEAEEVTGNRYVEFDIGVANTTKGDIEVDPSSTNRIKFTLEINRS
jgi:hypothetical protein